MPVVHLAAGVGDVDMLNRLVTKNPSAFSINDSVRDITYLLNN